MEARASISISALLLRLLLGSLFIAHLHWKFAVFPGGLEAWWGNLLRQGYPAFTQAGAELPLVWLALLGLQAVAGDGAWALVRSPSPMALLARMSGRRLAAAPAAVDS
jgi:putative oxidoreductase